MIQNKKICYFFKSGRENRIIKNHPDEFLYGLNFFRKKQIDVSIVNDRDLGFDQICCSKIFSVINIVVRFFIGIPGKSLIILFYKRKIFFKFDIIVVTTNSYGLSLAFLKKIGLIKSDIFYIAMGLLNNKTPKFWINVYKWILKDCKVVTLSKPDSQFLEKKLNYKFDVINFGVDKKFWTPSNKNVSKNYVISIGNDLNRDYKTLIRAWKNEFPLLKIITNHKLVSNKKNIEIIKGDWAKEILSDQTIRSLIRDCLFVILPISDTIQPSGQSVALQSMSCAKTVLINDFRGLWDKELLLDYENVVLLGEPGNEEKLKNIVNHLIKNKNLLKKIGLNARNIVEKKLNSHQMAIDMFNIMEDYAVLKTQKQI